MTSIETYPSVESDYLYSESDFDGYSAAPLLIIGKDADPQLVKKQDELGHLFNQLADSELGDYVKPGVIDFVKSSITSRMHMREGLNGISYLQRPQELPVHFDEAIPKEEIHEACEKLKYGQGTVLQNELARCAFGMTSVEYANLTIIGGARKHLEPSMWDEVGALAHSDAYPTPGDMTDFRILGYDRDITGDRNVSAMRIGMKRSIGKTEYGATVKNRTSVIIRPIALFRNMGASDAEYHEFTGELQNAARLGRDIMQVPGFTQAVNHLVSTTLPAGIVLARNETVYGIEKA